MIKNFWIKSWIIIFLNEEKNGWRVRMIIIKAFRSKIRFICSDISASLSSYRWKSLTKKKTEIIIKVDTGKLSMGDYKA